MFKCAFVLGLALAVIVCLVFGPSRAAPIKPSSCRNDNECAEGQFCGIKYGLSSCTDCLNCAAFNREPGIAQCVKRRSECGECLAGFVDTGYQCSQNAKDIPTFEYPNSGYNPPNKPMSAHAAIRNSIFEVKNVGSINHAGETQKVMPPGQNVWIVISASAILSISVVIGLVTMFRRRSVVVQDGPRNKDEEMELQPMSQSTITQSPGDGDRGPTADPNPSEPREELLKNRPSHSSGGYEHAGLYAFNTVQKLIEPIRLVTQMADSERIVSESYQEANPFSAGNAAGEEAQEFLAQHDLDEEAIYEDDIHPALELIEQELRQLPAVVEPPPQQVPQVGPENLEAAANNFITEESMDLGVVPQDVEEVMDFGEGIPQNDNDELYLEISLDLADLVPAARLDNDPAGDDSGNSDDDGVVPGSPTLVFYA